MIQKIYHNLDGHPFWDELDGNEKTSEDYRLALAAIRRGFEEARRIIESADGESEDAFYQLPDLVFDGEEHTDAEMDDAKYVAETLGEFGIGYGNDLNIFEVRITVRDREND